MARKIAGFFRKQFSRADKCNKMLGFSPCMSRPSRESDPSSILATSRTFFVTSKSAQGRSILQSERMASLFIEVLRSYVKAKRFVVHEFTVMPNHVHLL